MVAALAGTAGSIGFAGLAAATYSGVAAPTSNPVSEPQAAQIAPQPVTAPVPIQVAQPATRSRGRARVTSGGSG
jgi:hypothetical protein